MSGLQATDITLGFQRMCKGDVGACVQPLAPMCKNCRRSFCSVLVLWNCIWKLALRAADTSGVALGFMARTLVAAGVRRFCSLPWKVSLLSPEDSGCAGAAYFLLTQNLPASQQQLRSDISWAAWILFWEQLFGGPSGFDLKSLWTVEFYCS